MTIWAVNDDQHDKSAAHQYGSIRYISPRYVYGDEIVDGAMPGDFSRALEQATVQFDFEHDYVLICGDHLQLVAFMALLGNEARGASIHVLRYDKKAEGYIPVWV